MTLHPLIPSHLDQLLLELAAYVAKALLLLIFYIGRSHGVTALISFVAVWIFLIVAAIHYLTSKSPKMSNSISTMDSLSLVNLQ